MTEQKLIPTLYNLASAQSFRCLWALEELAAANGTKYHLKNFQRAYTYDKELKNVNPLVKFPMLTVETSDGSPPPTIQVDPGVVTEAKLILEFLSEEYGQGLFEPETPEDRRRDNFYSNFAIASLNMKTDFAVIWEVIPSVLPFPFNKIAGFFTWPVVWHWKKDIAAIHQSMEDHLGGGNLYMSGSKLGLADFNCSWGMDTGDQRGYFDGKKYPKLEAWLERIRQRPAYKSALEKGCGYDLKRYGM